jgi:hypothetical protein
MERETTSLTQCERDALYTALDQGYFAVPRDVPLSELADELDMADVELSEQLRRGTAALIQQHRTTSRSPSNSD